MSDIALKLIAENIAKFESGENAKELDLGFCGMTDVPEEISTCHWLEILFLSDVVYDWIEEDLTHHSLNRGKANKLTRLPGCLSNLKKLRVLTFNDAPAIDDLSVLSELNNLEILVMSGTNIFDLSPLTKLKKLSYIDFSNTNVTDLAPLKNLDNLIRIDAYGCEMSDLSYLEKLKSIEILLINSKTVSDFSFLKGLTNLNIVSLAGSNFDDITNISELSNITYLDISVTNIENINLLKNLKNITRLELNSTKVSDISALSSLKELINLVISQTKVDNLEPLRELKNLKYLDCSNTGISNLNALSDLTDIEVLLCSDTKIKDVHPLKNHSKLKSLDLSKTLIEDISPIIRQNQSLEVSCNNSSGSYGKILVNDCPLINPPIEFAYESHRSVMEYYDDLADGGQNLNEVKVIFLGEASAGKTTLIKRLLGEEINPHESQTHGIQIRKMNFELSNGETITSNLWDFGGQEVMHATHQFFLTQRSIYVILLNSRNDEQAEKWLKYVTVYGGASPILVVLNKIDENPSFEVNQRQLSQKYPCIRGYFRLSAFNGTGFSAFHEALTSQIEISPTRKTPFPASWFSVKEYFYKMQKNYIETSDFENICEQKGVASPSSQKVLLRFLHDLGIVINFNNLDNFDTQILNPAWLTGGVYRIINSELVSKNGGVFKELEINTIINDPRYKAGNTSVKEYNYPKNKLMYIVRIMEEFELCFAFGSRNYVVPQLLPVNEPDYNLTDATLRIIIKFDGFMPDSLFPRLMVKLHTYITDEKRWRTGMILSKLSIFDAYASVIWDKVEHSITINAGGAERKRFVTFIRGTIEEIISGFSSIRYDELVPVPDTMNEKKLYSELVIMEQSGQVSVFSTELRKLVPLASLLDGVEENESRSLKSEVPIKVFVSYAHKDKRYLKECRTALSPIEKLQNVEIWDDRSIDAGSEWREVIMQRLKESQIVLCLVSSDFIASHFCYEVEFKEALVEHNKGAKIIIPIKIREANWDNLPIATLQSLPYKWMSVTNRDKDWTEVSKSIEKRIEGLRERHLRPVKKPIVDTVQNSVSLPGR
jgi:internalin A